MTHTQKSLLQGFSLVELSIVLVILGLLVGGIFTGQSLVHASEMRGVGTEYGRYDAAVKTFRDKYFTLPGDFTRATELWGTDPNGCGTTVDQDPTTGTCNGNGDGAIAAFGSVGESHRFWQHLANAGLIEGVYSGRSGPMGGWQSVAGRNGPASKFGPGVWSARYLGYSGASYYFNYDFGNVFILGTRDDWGNTNSSWNPLMKPDEALSIDTKLDDGKSGNGKIIGFQFANLGWAQHCSSATSNTDFNAGYRTSVNTASCAFFIRNAF